MLSCCGQSWDLPLPWPPGPPSWLGASLQWGAAPWLGPGIGCTARLFWVPPGSPGLSTVASRTPAVPSCFLASAPHLTALLEMAGF